MRRHLNSMWPRRGDFVLLLISVYLIGCAFLPAAFVIDWHFLYAKELLSPVSGSALGILAGLGNAFSSWLVFGRITKARRIISIVSFGLLSAGAYWFGVQCAAIDVLGCRESVSFRWLPVFWLSSILVFLFAKVMIFVDNRFRRMSMDSPSHKRRSLIVWLGAPLILVLWLAHLALQVRLISLDNESLVPYWKNGLFLLFVPAVIMLAVIPVAICWIFARRVLRSLVLVAYFIVLSSIGKLMTFDRGWKIEITRERVLDYTGEFALIAFYGLAFLSGIFLSRWYREIPDARDPKSFGAPSANRKSELRFSLPATAVAIGATFVASWFFATYDLLSLLKVNSPQRWQIAELNRTWGRSVDRSSWYGGSSVVDLWDLDLTIDRPMTHREWRIISSLPSTSLDLDGLEPQDIPSDVQFPAGIQEISISNCRFDKTTWQVFFNLPALRELDIDECGHLWSEISKIRQHEMPLRIHYWEDDVVPKDRVRLLRQENITLEPGESFAIIQPFESRDTSNGVDWEMLAQHVGRNADGQIVRLEMPGIALTNEGIAAIGGLSELQWLAVSGHNCRRCYSGNIKANSSERIFEEVDFAPFGQLHNLRHVRIEENIHGNDETITGEKAMFAILGKSNSVLTMEVELRPSQPKAEYLRPLRGAATLKKLTLKSEALELADVRELLALPNLKELVICSRNKELVIDKEMDALMRLAPDLTIRRATVERYEWPDGGEMPLN